MQIYLLNERKFQGVQNLVLNEIVYYDFTIDLNEFDALIITSKNALKALEKSKNVLNLELKIYAVGQSTANFASKLGFKNVNFPKKSYANELVKEFCSELKGQKCLYLRAKKIASNLNTDLRALGVDLTEIIVYENIDKALKDFKLIQPCIFIFSSPSSVENFLKNFKFHPKDTIIALGQSTASKLKAYENLIICEKQNLNDCVAMAKNIIKQN